MLGAKSPQSMVVVPCPSPELDPPQVQPNAVFHLIRGGNVRILYGLREGTEVASSKIA